jgi:hypothetical protein
MSLTRDNSLTTRANLLKAKTFAVYHRLNPTVNMFAQCSYGAESEQLFLNVGNSVECCAPVSNCVPPSGGVSFNVGGLYPPPAPYDASYNVAYDITWDPVTNATSYNVVVSYPDVGGSSLVLNTGPTSITLYVNWVNPYSLIGLSVTAINSCGSTSGSTTLAPCFLAGSLVSMADGSTRVIEDVAVGDEVIGAFGEINRVLALHRPLLGENTMTRINGTHSTSSHHPHISVDRKFYCAAPSVVENNTYGREHIVINAQGNKTPMMLHGLKKGRVQALREGIMLKTIDGGRVVESFEMYTLPPDTQLYNLVVGGSHTYHVDGYAVTGWPREDDFDYDNWRPIF